MRMNLNKKSIAACIMVGAIAVTGSGAALAANVSTPAKEIKSYCSQQANLKSTFETAIKTLVSKGTLTQEQADNILNSCTTMQGPEKRGAPKRMNSQNGFGFANQLVNDGTITQEQATAIKTAMQAARDSQKPLTDVLTELVSSGVLTQAQADALTARMPNKDHPKYVGLLDQLTKNGIITQEQETAIKSELNM